MHLRLRVRAAVPVAVLFLVSLFVAGCGSSGSSTSTEATATITKAQFVAKGNAVCVAGDKAQEAKIVALFKAHGLQENEDRPRPNWWKPRKRSMSPASRVRLTG
jgi:uncharacterized protein (UPF0303 family)